MIPVLASVVLLVLLLVAARTQDGAGCREFERAWNNVVSDQAREVLSYLTVAVEEHRIGLEVLSRATRAEDTARLCRAIEIVEGFAPGLEEGLTAVRNMSKVVSALIPMPPLGPSMWNAWHTRGLAGVSVVMHYVLVAAAERARVRLWLLRGALKVCLSSLRRSSEMPEPEWRDIDAALRDLTIVGAEAETTYRRIVTALDNVGGLLPVR